MEAIRVGIVGSGFMGQTYAEVLDKHINGARLAGVAVGRRAPALAAAYGVPAEESLAALLARPDIDAVILATPEQIRLEQLHASAAAGKHILSEKPLAPDTAQADQMIAACRAAGVTLMVCQTARYRGTFAHAKRLVDEGRIGRVLQIRSFVMGTLRDYTDFVGEKPWIADPASGGFFYDQAVHNFDFMRWLTSSEAQQVFAYVTSQRGPYPAMSVMAQVQFASGALAQMNLCFELPEVMFPEHTFRFMVIGEQGLLDFDMYTSLRLGTEQGWETVWEQPTFDYVNDPNSPIRLAAHAAMVQEFITSLHERRPPAIRGEDGRAAVALCEACVESARRGQAITLGAHV
jgi:predicted dehydrogenase